MPNMILHTRALRSSLFFLASVCSITAWVVEGFSLMAVSTRSHSRIGPLHLVATRRYGPIDDHHQQQQQQEEEESNAHEAEFRTLLQKVMEVTEPEHLPGLLGKHISLLVASLSGASGARMVQRILKENDLDDSSSQALEERLETMVSFTEDFVEQASQLDRNYKELLGTILRAMSKSSNEENLDQVLQEHRDQLSMGFLRHLEGECERIANAPKTTPDSLKLLETLHVLRTRVLEEMGESSSFGEAGLVLGQLIGYESMDERLAVLEAGLVVRGVEFGREMKILTEEALDGFTRVPGGADAGLVQCVTEIDERLQKFLDDNNEAFQ